MITAVQLNDHGQTFALDVNGVLYAWGENAQKTLGLGTGADGKIYTPTQVLADVRQILTTKKATYAVKTDGSVYQWGEVSSQTGNIRIAEPQQIKGLSDIREMYSIQNRQYAISNSGILYAWGDNSQNSLGIGEEHE